jgi:DNA-directed RNA polymerase specialized sigma24 family protein
VSRPALDRDTEHLLRDLAPQVLGSLVRRYRDFAACEDAVQEALIAAADAGDEAACNKIVAKMFGLSSKEKKMIETT